MSANDRGYESLSSRISGIEDMFEKMVGQVTTTLRKEIRALDDRLTRRVDSDQKEEAANLYNMKRDLTVQMSGDIAAAEDRITRRLDNERREQKEAIADLRRELSTQQAVQDTASFATQRVVPKESEDVGKVRAAVEELRAVADNAQKDVARLAQDLCDQKSLYESMEMSIRKSVPKNEEMSALRQTLDKTLQVADQTQKDFKRLEKDVADQKLRSDNMETSVQSMAAPTRGYFGLDNPELASLLVTITAEPVAEMRSLLEQQMSDMESELVKRIDATKEELSGKIVTLELVDSRLKRMEGSRLDFRLTALESAAQRAANFSQTGESALFQPFRPPVANGAVGGCRDLDVSQNVAPAASRPRTDISDFESRCDSMFANVGGNMSAAPATPQAHRASLEFALRVPREQRVTKPGDRFLEGTETLIPDDLKNRLENLVEQVKETLNSSQLPQAIPAEPDEYLPSGQPNGMVENYMPYETDDYATRPAAICNGGSYQPVPVASFQHFQQPVSDSGIYPQYAAANTAPSYQQPLARYCHGSVALPLSREADVYSDHGPASELGVHPTSFGSVQAPLAPLSAEIFGSLDGDGGASYDGGGGYEAGYEHFAGGEMSAPPFTAVSYGPPTVVGYGPPVLHSVTTRMGRPMSPVRESSPIRGASPVRAASPVRGMSPVRSTMQYHPRHRELSPLRARSTGDPAGYQFNPERLMSSGRMVTMATTPVPTTPMSIAGLHRPV
ncbi:unnamed protein product [Symbiodinium pilosum]|uniref:Uncharacterized protein n=1 Tax=Symbiodinium pilosum TaxID=2952 RepID=A0A812M471_SYMPI|nr:unnamed protein product [Symbiodinium pilosum]